MEETQNIISSPSNNSNDSNGTFTNYLFTQRVYRDFTPELKNNNNNFLQPNSISNSNYSKTINSNNNSSESNYYDYINDNNSCFNNEINHRMNEFVIKTKNNNNNKKLIQKCNDIINEQNINDVSLTH